MQLHALIKKLDEIDSSDRKSIFESIGGGDSYFVTWEREIHPVLCEVALDPTQIQQLFKDIEKSAGRSGLGKAADAVKGAADKVGDVWFNKFGGMLQNSAPVKAFDQKWEDLKSSIAVKHPDLAAKLAKYGEFAKAHPNLHKFLLAIGGSVAAAVGVAAAGGVTAGALAVGTGTGVAVGILNIADRLLQGQKLSTSVGRGATTGAIAGLAAGAAAKIGELVRTGIKQDAIAQLDGMRVTKHSMNYNGQPFYAVTKEPETSALTKAFRSMSAENPESVQRFADLMAKVSGPNYQQQISQTKEIATAIKAAATSSMGVVKDLMNIGTAAAGGAASAATNQQPKESLSESQIQELFGFTGNKFDAAKLEKMWAKAGSPTDSEEIAKILTNAGVHSQLVAKIYQDMGVEIPTWITTTSSASSTTSVNTKDLLAQILKLDKNQQQTILALLKA